MALYIWPEPTVATVGLATEATLLLILGQLDVDLSTRASEATLTALSGKVANNFGAAAGAVRTAAQVGNASGAADFGAGAVSAQTQRTTPASDSPHLLATRHEAAATPLAARGSNGTNFDAYGSGNVDATTPRVAVAADQITSLQTGTKAEYTAPAVPVLRDFSVSGLTAATWSQLVASTAAKATRLGCTNTSAYPIEVGFGAGGAEVSQFVVPTGARSTQILVPAGTRIALRCASAVSAGDFTLDYGV